MRHVVHQNRNVPFLEVMFQQIPSQGHALIER